MRMSGEITPIDQQSWQECRSPEINHSKGIGLWGSSREDLFYCPAENTQSYRAEYRPDKIKEVSSPQLNKWNYVRTPPVPQIHFTLQSPKVEEVKDIRATWQN